MSYLLCVHLMRQLYDYGSYALDITGPLMIITQKVTSLAFSIHDGFVRKEEVSLVNEDLSALTFDVLCLTGPHQSPAVPCHSKNAYCLGVFLLRLALPQHPGRSSCILQGLHWLCGGLQSAEQSIRQRKFIICVPAVISLARCLTALQSHYTRLIILNSQSKGSSK